MFQAVELGLRETGQLVLENLLGHVLAGRIDLGFAEEVLLVVIILLTSVARGNDKVRVGAPPAQRAIEVVKAQPLRIPGALNVGARVRSDKAHVVGVLTGVHMPARGDISLTLARARLVSQHDIAVLVDLLDLGKGAAVGAGKPDGRADDRFSRTERREVAPVDDAEVVVGTMRDDGAPQNLDALETLDWRPEVDRGVEPKREVICMPILHDEHLARAPRGRTAHADAAVLSGRVIVDDDDTRHARQGFIDVAGLVRLENFRRQVGCGRREAFQVCRNELGRIEGCRGRLRCARGRTARGRRTVNRIVAHGRGFNRLHIGEFVRRRRDDGGLRSRRGGGLLLRLGLRLGLLSRRLGGRRLLLKDLHLRNLALVLSRGSELSGRSFRTRGCCVLRRDCHRSRHSHAGHERGPQQLPHSVISLSLLESIPIPASMNHW